MLHSNIWKFYLTLEKETKAGCISCGHKLTINGTAGLIYHLKVKHPESYAQFREVSAGDPSPRAKSKKSKFKINLVNRPKRIGVSKVWEFFEAGADKTRARCMGCNVEIVRGQTTSTGSFIKHLQAKHPDLHEQFRRSMIKEYSIDSAANEDQVEQEKETVKIKMKQEIKSKPPPPVPSDCSEADKASMLDYVLNEVRDANGEDVLLLSDLFWEAAADENVTELPAAKMKKVFRDELLPSLSSTTLINKPERDFLMSVMPVRYKHVIQQQKLKKGKSQSDKINAVERIEIGEVTENGQVNTKRRRKELAEKVRLKAGRVAEAKGRDNRRDNSILAHQVLSALPTEAKTAILQHQKSKLRCGSDGNTYTYLYHRKTPTIPGKIELRGRPRKVPIGNVRIVNLSEDHKDSRTRGLKAGKIPKKLKVEKVVGPILPTAIRLPAGSRKPRAEMLQAVNTVLNGDLSADVAAMQFGVSFSALKSILCLQEDARVSDEIKAELELFKTNPVDNDDLPCCSKSRVTASPVPVSEPEGELLDVPRFGLDDITDDMYPESTPSSSTDPALIKAVHSVLQGQDIDLVLEKYRTVSYRLLQQELDIVRPNFEQEQGQKKLQSSKKRKVDEEQSGSPPKKFLNHKVESTEFTGKSLPASKIDRRGRPKKKNSEDGPSNVESQEVPTKSQRMPKRSSSSMAEMDKVMNPANQEKFAIYFRRLVDCSFEVTVNMGLQMIRKFLADLKLSKFEIDRLATVDWWKEFCSSQNINYTS